MRRARSLQRDLEAGSPVKWLCRAMIALAAIYPFVVFPGIERPFSTPKIVLLGGFVIVAGTLAVSTGSFRLPPLPAGFRLGLISWPFALIVSSFSGVFVSQEALWLSLFSQGWFLLVLTLRPKYMHIAMAVAISCGITAIIALWQYLGLDPFRILGWTTPAYGSPRMRVFGTLGNPNFVAAVLVAGMPLSIQLGKHLKLRALYYVAIALEVAAVFATGSRAAIAALIAALVWLWALGQFARWRLMMVAALIVIALLPLMPSRSLVNTLDGRLYIWRVTASHLFERPLLRIGFGFGPGAFEPKFIEWETAYWRDGRGTAGQRRFSGLQAHAHNDYLEILVDSGFAAVLSLWFLLGSFFAFVFQLARNPSGDFSAGAAAGASSGVVALAAAAVVDYPFHRPVELFFLWTLMAIVFLQADLE